MGCGCKCDCPEGLCVDNTCWGCNPCPPPTCGCNEGLLSGETCLNQTYYYYGYDQDDTPYYYSFSFGYVIFISSGGSMDVALEFFFQQYFCWDGICGITNYTLTTTESDTSGYTLNGSGSAQNCFMWQSNIEVELPPFTSYLIDGCNSNWDQGTEFNCNGGGCP